MSRISWNGRGVLMPPQQYRTVIYLLWAIIETILKTSRFRDVGFVSLEMLKGKAVMVFWPLDQMKTLP